MRIRNAVLAIALAAVAGVLAAQQPGFTRKMLQAGT